MITCDKCGSNNITNNGHPGGFKNMKKQQFYCKNCNSYFYEKENIQYPPTSIPFPFIADSLHFWIEYKKRNKSPIPMDIFRKQVNNMLVYYQIRDKGKGVSRQTIHYWIDNYSELIDNQELMEQVRADLEKRKSKLYKNQKHDNVKFITIDKIKLSHMEALKNTELYFGGQKKALEFAKKDKKHFENVIEFNSYYKLPIPNTMMV